MIHQLNATTWAIDGGFIVTTLGDEHQTENKHELFIGDALIAEFPTPVDACLHAVNMRKSLYALLNSIMAKPMIPD